MRTVTAGASDSELLVCVSEWTDLMAAGDFAAAAGFLHPPSEESNAEHWSASSLETYIANYGSWDELDDGERMRVTPIGDAKGANPAPHDVYRFDDRPPHIEFTLPLNGEWSDLTALFDLVEVDGRWAFTLYDLHVL